MSDQTSQPEVKERNKGGRPSLFSQDLADVICEQLVEGHSLRAICRREDMPAISSVFKWMREHPKFSEQYALAKQEQVDTLADEIIEIADERELERVEVDGVLMAIKYDAVAVNRNRLRVDARKWAASKLKPKKYGEKVSQEISGPDGGPVQVDRIERRIVRPGDEG